MFSRTWSNARKNEWGEWVKICRVNGIRYPMGDIHGPDRQTVENIWAKADPFAPLVPSDDERDNKAFDMFASPPLVKLP